MQSLSWSEQLCHILQDLCGRKLWDTCRRKKMKACYQPIFPFLNVGSYEIELKDKAQQKFFWFIFYSLTGSYCSGSPVTAAQGGLFIEKNKQALVSAATATQVFWSCQATFPWLDVKLKLSICEVPQKSVVSWKYFWKRNESSAGYGGWRVS